MIRVIHKKRLSIGAFIVMVMLLFFSNVAVSQEYSAERLSFDKGWRFHEGDIPFPVIKGHGMSYANAKQLLDESFRRWRHNLCTLKQAAALKRYGYETANMGREDASRIIGELAANQWRPLSEVCSTGRNEY